jgi:hypothetical protein
MAILEYASNLSSLLDLVLVVIGVATAGFAIKVKFINEARKAAKEAETSAIRFAEEIHGKVMIEHGRIDDQWRRINSCETDIAMLKERTRSL